MKVLKLIFLSILDLLSWLDIAWLKFLKALWTLAESTKKFRSPAWPCPVLWISRSSLLINVGNSFLKLTRLRQTFVTFHDFSKKLLKQMIQRQSPDGQGSTSTYGTDFKSLVSWSLFNSGCLLTLARVLLGVQSHRDAQWLCWRQCFQNLQFEGSQSKSGTKRSKRIMDFS